MLAPVEEDEQEQSEKRDCHCDRLQASGLRSMCHQCPEAALSIPDPSSDAPRDAGHQREPWTGDERAGTETRG
jgi:hypothetical protein